MRFFQVLRLKLFPLQSISCTYRAHNHTSTAATHTQMVFYSHDFRCDNFEHTLWLYCSCVRPHQSFSLLLFFHILGSFCVRFLFLFVRSFFSRFFVLLCSCCVVRIQHASGIGYTNHYEPDKDERRILLNYSLCSILGCWVASNRIQCIVYTQTHTHANIFRVVWCSVRWLLQCMSSVSIRFVLEPDVHYYFTVHINFLVFLLLIYRQF